MKKQKKQFPKNYRTITERLGKLKKQNSKLLQKIKFESLVFLYAVTIVLILISTFNLFQNFQKQKEIDLQREKIQSEIKVWQGVTDKFTQYKEGYYQLGILEYELGDIEKAKFYISKSLYLDPNFDKAREFQKILNNY